MSRSLTAAQAAVLGLVVVAGAVLAGGGLFAVGSRAWYGRDAFTVRAGFKDIRGVEVGTRVRVQGIDAGEVVRIEPPGKPGGLVLLHLKLRGDYRRLVNSTATVQIVGEGMIGGKVVEVVPGPDGPSVGPVADNALLATASSAELGDLLDEANGLVKDARAGKGSLGKLVSDPELHDEVVSLVKDARQTMTALRKAAATLDETAESVRQVSDSADRLPLLGGYIESPTALLVRANAERDRKVFAEGELFEPGRAVLTAAGKKRLDGLKEWLDASKKHDGSEVMVVTYADPAAANGTPARVLTRQQSEAVSDYLVKQHKAQKIGWFSSRRVVPLGMGTAAPPTAEKEPLPAGRVEVIVFLPQK